MKNRFGALLGLVSSSALAQSPPPPQLPLMPWPAAVSLQSGSLPIDGNFSVSVVGPGARDERVQAAVERVFPRLARQMGIPLRQHMAATGENATLAIVVERPDHAAPQRVGDNERYSLEVGDGRIQLSADAPLGVLRGLETFLQLVQQNGTFGVGDPASPGFSTPAVAIHDEPRFPWRGLSLDVARHFFPVDQVKRTLDGMAAVKLNVFHWHLSDDQGFRIESKLYPRLQEYGSDGLFYTQAEARDVIAYARARGIRVIPEFDMPGHATSWLPGYPQLGSGHQPYKIERGFGIFFELMNPANEAAYRFLDGFVGEMTQLFPDEYFHIGGDEVDPREWNSNADIQAFMRKQHLANPEALQTYFSQRLLKIVTRHGKHMEGWDEVLNPDLPKSVIIQSWRGQESLWEAARQGYRGILSAGYYLDLMHSAAEHYAIDPMKLPPERQKRLEEQGKPIPAKLTPEEEKNVLGGEGAMWAEFATPENLDAKLWPRLAAIAERLWSPESVTDVASMYARLEVTNRRLEWLGLTQRSNLELMRQRLAGAAPYQPLDRFASLLEPVKGYSRHAERYKTSSPLNRLVDAIAPESDAAREFRDGVDRYLAGGRNPEAANRLRQHLALWQDDAATVRAIFQTHSILRENLELAEAIEALCKAGQQALSYLDGEKQNATADWKRQNLAMAGEAGKPHGDILIPMAAGVQALLNAVSATP